MTGPTRVQLETLRAIAEMGAPTIRDLLKRFGLKSTNAVNDRLLLCAKKGLVEFGGKTSRSIRLTDVGWDVLGVPQCPACGARRPSDHTWLSRTEGLRPDGEHRAPKSD